MTKQPHGPSRTKRSVKISGRVTSVTLEDAFWGAFKEIAATKGVTAQDLVRRPARAIMGRAGGTDASRSNEPASVHWGGPRMHALCPPLPKGHGTRRTLRGRPRELACGLLR